MNVETASRAGVELLTVSGWTKRGISNGFLGAALDSRGEQERCDSFVREYCGTPDAPVHRLKQIHSDIICDLTERASVPQGFEADGWFFPFGKSEGIFGIETADCAPLLITARDKSFGAALHCGWRGTVAGLLQRTIELFAAHGKEPSDLELVIGPCASGCCYEVGPEVREVVERDWWGSGLSERNGKTFLDLGALLADQSLHLGLTTNAIARIGACTICNQRFFSYRRQIALAGRQLSFICSI